MTSDLEAKEGWQRIREIAPAVPIKECGEPLIEIPRSFPRYEPHVYVIAGAPYGNESPFMLRQGIVERLLKAQALLSERMPGHRLKIFDGYRPVPVQAYMVEFTIAGLARDEGLDPAALAPEIYERLRGQALQIFAPPKTDPTSPPPHSTGAAVDLTICDENGFDIDMGGAIDDMPPISYPDYFENASDPIDRARHERRQLLRSLMMEAGFRRLIQEWWHFCYGDQVWAALLQVEDGRTEHAVYGRCDLIEDAKR